MTRSLLRFVPVLAFALSAMSCATTQITNSWKKPGAPHEPFAKILVVSLSTQENVRRAVEDEFMTRLQELGAIGVPSYTLAADTQALSRKEKIDLVKASGADGALLVRLVKVENKTQYNPGYYDPGTGFYNHWHGAWGGAYIPPTVYSYDIVYLETQLFDVKSEDLVWAVATETTDPGKLEKEIAGYVDIILSALKKDALLPAAAK